MLVRGVSQVLDEWVLFGLDNGREQAKREGKASYQAGQQMLRAHANDRPGLGKAGERAGCAKPGCRAQAGPGLPGLS
jgi:hypothetical protein